MTVQSINPATGEVLACYQEMTPERAQGAVEQAHKAFLSWRRTGFAARAERMHRAAEELRQNADG